MYGIIGAVFHEGEDGCAPSLAAIFWPVTILITIGASIGSAFK